MNIIPVLPEKDYLEKSNYEQYRLFQKRLVEFYYSSERILHSEMKESQNERLLMAFRRIEEADNRCIKNTLKAVAEKKIQAMEIASLLLVNRLFTQFCRMQIYSMKDLLLTQEKVLRFDHAMEAQKEEDLQKVEPA